MQEVGRTSRELARAALEHARVSRLVYKRGGFEGLEPIEVQVLLAALITPAKKTVGELAELFELKRPTVSNAVAKLTSAKLLDADPDPTDARSQVLRTTAKGREVAERFLAHARPHLRTH